MPTPPAATEPSQSQVELWNGRVGEKWVALDRHVETMLKHVTTKLHSRVGSVAGQRVLDIGCGTGETCLIWLEGGAEVTGVDISRPMLAVAANRTTGKVKLIEADASSWTGDTPFDVAVSRFGVMFFADPDAAFANTAANPHGGGRLVFVCWRPAAENQWVTVPMDAIRDLLPELPPNATRTGPVRIVGQGAVERNPGARRVRADFDSCARRPSVPGRGGWRLSRNAPCDAVRAGRRNETGLWNWVERSG